MRKMSRRGVMFPTMACNVKCVFCYYYDQSGKTWRPREEVLKEASNLREKYGLEAVDITGGEPTVYPEMEALVSHCSRIGLKPAIITNGILTGRIAGLIADCGLDDVLLSIHGFRDKHSAAVGKPEAWESVGLTIDGMVRRGFSFRTNTTLTTFCVPELDSLAEFFVRIKPRMVNFINFNPYPGTAWTGVDGVSFQLRFSEIAPKLREALEILEQAGIWANVRYLPICFLKGFEGHVCGFRQLPYDPYEWECFSVHGVAKGRAPVLNLKALVGNVLGPFPAGYVFGTSPEERASNHLAALSFAQNVFGPKCRRCSARWICDGLSPQYARNFGTDEVLPYEDGEVTRDPLFFRGRFEDRWGKLKD